MLPRFLPLAAILALTISQSHAQSVQKRTFPNGLTVLVQENRAAPVVAVRIYVKTGSIYEDKFLGSGLSHLFEHTLFEGTKTRDKKALNDELQAIGGQSNAYTSYDVTAYHVTTAAPYFGRALAVLADMTQNATFPDAEIKVQQGVIHNEMNIGEDDPDRALGELFDQTAFRVHPARYPIIGYREQFDRISREEIVGYYKSHYTPGNSVLSVAGDVSAPAVFAAAEREFGKWQRNAPQALALPSEPLQTSPRRAVIERGVAQTSLQMGWHTIPLQNPDLYALDTLAQILSGDDLSRLVKKIRETGLASAVAAYSSTPNYDAGIFAVRATLPPQNIGKVERAILAEVENIKRNGVTASELSRAKRGIRSSFIFSKQGVENQAEQNAYDELGTGDPSYSSRYVNRIQGVTSAQIQAVAKKYLYADGLTTAVVKPRGKAVTAAPKPAPMLTNLADGRVLAPEMRPASQENSDPIANLADAPVALNPEIERAVNQKVAVLNRYIAALKAENGGKAPGALAELQNGGAFAPEMFQDSDGEMLLYDATSGVVSRRGAAKPAKAERGAAPDASKPAARRAASGVLPRAVPVRTRAAATRLVRLPNGLTLILRPNRGAPTVSMTVTGLGGVRLENPKQGGISALAAQMVTRGTSRRNADGIANVLGDLGGDVSGFAGFNSYGVTGSFLAGDWRRGLNLVAESTLSPTFPASELAQVKTQTLAALASQGDDPMTTASILLRRTFYGNHPYGRNPLGSAGSVKSIDSAALKAFWQRTLQPKSMVLSIAGQFDAAQVEVVARQLFGGFKGVGKLPKAPAKVAAPPSFTFAGRQKAGLTQAVLWFGFPSIDLKNEDRFALDVLDAALSGADLPGGRLHERLRNSQLVYVTHSYDSPGLDGGMFVIYAATEPKNRAEVRRVIEEEISKVQSENISDAELERAKTMMISSHAIDLQTNAEQARDLASNQLFGLGIKSSAEYAGKINRITVEDVRRVANQYLRLENAALAVVEPS